MTSHTHLRNPQVVGIAGLAALVGAVTAYFTSPRSGADNRKMVRDQAANVRDRMLQTKHGIAEAKEEVKQAPAAAKAVTARRTTAKRTTRTPAKPRTRTVAASRTRATTPTHKSPTSR